MSDFPSLQPITRLLRAKKRGPNASADFNQLAESVVYDLSQLYSFVNDILVPLLNGIKQSGTWNGVDAISQGLDGSTLLLDHDTIEVASVYHYNPSASRPTTVLEAFDAVLDDLEALYDESNRLRQQLIGAPGAAGEVDLPSLAELTTRVAALASRIRAAETSVGEALSSAEIAAAIDAETLDPASFHLVDADIEAAADIAPAKLGSVDLTAAYGYLSGVPAGYNLEDTVGRLKAYVEDVAGESFTDFAASNLSGDDLKTHRDKVGTGTPTATNPHGLDASDLSDAGGLLDPQLLVLDAVNEGLSGWTYTVVPETGTLVRVAGTVASGGTKTFSLFRNRAGAVAPLLTGATVPGTTPGSVVVTAGFAASDLQAGDLLYVSGVSGAGVNWRMQAWMTRT